ncbi:MAG: two-component system response regulator [Chloroflexi bacterium]|nr:MAG: two-component system response regulator [Chloroflexota bacterium]HDN79851.1 response regulator [Chloroflexota bacterium]
MAKILVAEDERDILELITFSLELGGFEVIQAMDGLEALEKAIVEKPDLVLLDIRMPKLTGYEVCEKLKESEVTRDIPVVFISAKGQEMEIKQGLEAGAVDYVVKPFAPDELIRKMQEIIDKYSKQG